ncbi:general stress protein [Pseudomonas shirazica]|uniref:general stress protein n=1 Tax=Pseudomonas shirazica TaxID=1940636 RepID=UPI002452AAB7|nr:general stress protein [Pseudomonas shirazica]MDH4432215.1 general stress protein [Pseudomonas shirazica]
MANDQDKSGQQGGTAQNNPGNFANDWEKASEAGHKVGQASGGNFANDPQRASEAGQKGGQMSGGRSEDQQKEQRSGNDLQEDDPQRAGGATQRGGQGGHTTGSRADREQGMDEGSQAIQDEDSGMTEDNR